MLDLLKYKLRYQEAYLLLNDLVVRLVVLEVLLSLIKGPYPFFFGSFVQKINFYKILGAQFTLLYIMLLRALLLQSNLGVCRLFWLCNQRCHSLVSNYKISSSLREKKLKFSLFTVLDYLIYLLFYRAL